MYFVLTISTAVILFQTIICVAIFPQKRTFQPIIAQHLGQDAFGRYTYGYITPTSTKSESKGTDGIIRGGYSYFDPKGNLQSVHYVADPVHGFLVAASNLPQDVPSVAYERQRHLQKYESIKAEHAALALSKQNPQTEPISGAVVVDLPKDVPAVAYAKQRHLERYEAIKAQHASLALSKNAPPAVELVNPVHDLPAVAKAKAQHLAAFEEIKARDLALRAAKIASGEVLVTSPESSYSPIIPSKGWNSYSYGYIHPVGSNDILYNSGGQGYSYFNEDGVLKTITYITN